MALAVLAVAQMGVRLVFFLKIATRPDKNVLFCPARLWPASLALSAVMVGV